MKILEIELLSDDINETESFYKRVLGLTPYQKEKGVLLFYKVGFTRLIFRKSKEIKAIYHFAIDVPNNRFKESYDFIAETTAIIPISETETIADFSEWNAESFYFYDNNGNILEFITRYDNNAVSDEVFSTNSYISISEIGLAAKKVAEFADKLIDKFGVSVFHRQPRGDRFTALGDDDGLFIIAINGRNWYPVEDKVYSYPAKVLFMKNAVTYQLVV
ncbi:MAG: hypothetical protein BM557_08550 [Flavobacterium sp. MedPE-SWcel]|uniref:VOC family protein n=1 Tax=uncultured Flavobacterium sp. TaxID=165435 RepID=UPI0009112042|nr:hypothetical protein [uncultured Flavobacterium sp.]OIQ17253.1 MAG: hypothetical protein BM557_08550 [Flavobacterium sp. MedPE-SWcel]